MILLCFCECGRLVFPQLVICQAGNFFTTDVVVDGAESEWLAIIAGVDVRRHHHRWRDIVDAMCGRCRCPHGRSLVDNANAGGGADGRRLQLAGGGEELAGGLHLEVLDMIVHQLLHGRAVSDVILLGRLLSRFPTVILSARASKFVWLSSASSCWPSTRPSSWADHRRQVSCSWWIAWSLDTRCKGDGWGKGDWRRERAERAMAQGGAAAQGGGGARGEAARELRARNNSFPS